MSSSESLARRVLLVEDDDEDYEVTRELFAEISLPVHELFRVLDFDSALAATRGVAYDVCLVDYRLAGAENGVDLARELITNGNRMPVILLTGIYDREVDERAANIGAADFLVKGDINAATLDRAIRYAIQSHAALRALQDSYRTTVRALAAVLELRDDQTGAHATRVTELALRLTERVAPELVKDDELEYGFLLHDIGKIGVPDAILLKKGKLDDAETALMKQHVTLGQRILRQIPYLNGTASEIAAAHHERWDGAGYPNGLHGDEIPLAARIFSIIDAFDAMTTDRPYCAARPVDDALCEIEQQAGRQFDPHLVRVFIEMMRREQSFAQSTRSTRRLVRERVQT